ncbi:MAG: O-antigen ligase family protein [Burkholderiaceae bacterium]|jgi:O-antigen ligase|nr:O-antigen ligase family protein [Burkholderiaceae bacterium]MEB2319116.1 O-antigen ligase family protein [Pseudomonadota bacterium]
MTSAFRDRQFVAAWLAAALPGLIFFHHRVPVFILLAWLVFHAWSWKTLRQERDGRSVLRSPIALGFATNTAVLAVLFLIHRDNWHPLDHSTRLLLALPAMAAIVILRPSCRPYFTAAAFGGIVAGAVAVWEVLITAGVAPSDPILGFSNRSKFSYVSASVLMLLCAASCLPGDERPARPWLVLGIAGALVAIVLANARSIWIATVIPLTIWMWSSPRFSLASRVRITGGSALLMAALALTPGSPVNDRIMLGLQQYEQYRPGQAMFDDSIGSRLDMLQVGLSMFREHPWVGVGPGQFTEELAPYVDSGMISADALRVGNPHNEYLSALATGGVIGLLGLMAVLAGPLLYFAGSIRRSGASSRSGACGLAGVLVVGLTAIFSAMDPLFHVHFSTIYYALTIAILGGFADTARRAAA